MPQPPNGSNDPRDRNFDASGFETPESTGGSHRQGAGEIVEDVKDKASQFGARVSERASEAVSSISARVGEAANALREGAPAAVAPYADRAADTVKRAASYLAEGDFKAYADDLSELVRRHPMPAMLTGVAVGILLARGSRR
jgi:ElaB/YqjD/DUF883 family membrane-anchored ribosome-binding protein